MERFTTEATTHETASVHPSESWAAPGAVFSLEIKKEEWSGEGREYELGKGATSKVLLADLTTSDGARVPVAVKMPLEPKDGRVYFSIAEVEQFLIDEEKRLHLLKEKQEKLFPGAPSHFPIARLTQIDEKPALVLELLERDSAIYLSRDSVFKGHPERAESVMRQYMDVLEIAHALDISMADKKFSDLYYTPENDRLVVLDWNVAREGDEDGHLSEETKKSDVALGLGIILKMLRDYFLEEKKNEYEALFMRLNRTSYQTSGEEAIALVRKVGGYNEKPPVTPVASVEEQVFRGLPYW